jgi:hypothetical protein
MMIPIALQIVASLFLCADPPPARSADGTTPRKPNPLAPSLPETTKQEEDKFDQIIDRFILADTGKIKGDEAKQALEDFRKLPPESVFALIRGLNRAAKINDSCPALVIAKRIASQMRTTRDIQLLTFTRENAGAGIGHSQYSDVIRDLRLYCATRAGALANESKGTIIGNSKP